MGSSFRHEPDNTREPLENEFNLLRAAAASCFDEKALVDVETYVRLVNWSHTLWLAQLHGQLAVVSDVLLRIDACPAVVRNQLKTFQRAKAVGRLLMSREVTSLVRAVVSTDVSVMISGGWALGEWCLPRNTLCRDTHKIDLLVRPADRPSLQRCLELLGHDLGPDPLRAVRRREIIVHIQEGLGTGDAQFDVPPMVWARADRRELGGQAVHTLALRDWFEHLSMALTQRRRITLSHAFDIVAIASRMGPMGCLQALGEAPPARRTPLAAALLASHDLLGITPACALAQTAPESGEVLQLQQVLRSRCSTVRNSEDGNNQKPVPVADFIPGSLGRYVPTPRAVVHRMLALARTTSADVVYDLGCGDGRIVIAAARNHGVKAVGVDADPRLLAAARANAAGLEELVTFVEADLLDVDVAEASVVCLYLQKFAYDLVRERVIKRLRPGARIVSHKSTFADWPPLHTEIVQSGKEAASLIFVWQLPSH